VTIALVDRLPSAEDYLALRRSVGWHALPENAVRTGLNHSLYAVCALSAQELVGCGRICGDGGIYFYVQDIIINPRFQRQGLGTRLVARLMAHIRRRAQTGAFIGLMAAPGLEGFYGRFGFRLYPEDSPGMLIWK
jgi:GNAT superfamily N-acetyltransferase